MVGTWPLYIVILVLVKVSRFVESSPENNENYNVSYLEHNPGLFYENLGGVKLVEKEWQIIVSIDFMAFHRKVFDVILPRYEETWNQCLDNLGKECELIMKGNRYRALLQEATLLSQHLQDIFQREQEEKETSRMGRAPLLGFIGSIQRSLFGVMDYNDYEHINKEIDKLYNSQNQITHLVNNATHIIKSEIDNMMSHIDRTARNMKFLKNITDKLEIQQNHQGEEVTKLHLAMQLRHIGEENEHAMEMLLDTTKKITEAIDAAKHGRITQTFLSPKQLDRATQRIHNEHPELEFPIPRGKTDYPALSKMSRIKIAHTKGKILIIMALPLLSRVNFQMYHVLPCSKPQKTTAGVVAAKIEPTRPYIIVTEDRHHYAQLEEKGLKESCTSLGNNFICLPRFAISNSVLKPVCEVMLLLRTNQQTLKICNIRLSPYSGTEWTSLGNTNKWMFSTIEEDTGHLYCHGNEVTSIKIIGTGILSLGPGCHVQTSTDKVSHLGILGRDETEIHLPQVDLDLHEVVNVNETSSYDTNLSQKNHLLPMPEINLRNFDIGLEESQRKLEEIGLQKQETYHHRLITFGSIGGVGLIGLLGTCYALCSRSVAFESFTAILRCCTRGTWRPKRKENPSAIEKTVQLEQLTSVVTHELPKCQPKPARVASEPTLSSMSPSEATEHHYEPVHRAASSGTILQARITPSPKKRIISV